ncbi:hypothetical protein DN752_04755 [Echinicola strongylocentroti]|uniref:Uncharacterized protein n=1 Tax=Echinicola strongylocentroti TaxID=1795355 RepID=A0A2Z4IG85_9BACT|nr:hypothetical protein DN752_04755 [Echinicola strongylocentroti]
MFLNTSIEHGRPEGNLYVLLEALSAYGKYYQSRYIAAYRWRMTLYYHSQKKASRAVTLGSSDAENFTYMVSGVLVIYNLCFIICLPKCAIYYQVDIFLFNTGPL